MASSAFSKAQQLRLARAWRERLRADAGGHLQVTRRCDRRDASARLLADTPHCASLVVKSDGAGDTELRVARLGEVLRLVRLATAPHVDPVVFNALWDDDALCAMGPSLCLRCDDVDRGTVVPTVTLSVAPTVTLSVAYDRRDPPNGGRSGVALIHDALYAWQEAAASDEFVHLRDALGSWTASDSPAVQLELTLGLFDDNGDMELRDLQVLAAQMPVGEASPQDNGARSPFRLARVRPLMRAARVESPHYAPLHTFILDARIGIYPGPLLRPEAPPEEAKHAWQWLIDWAERTNAPPLQVEALTIARHPAQTAQVLVKMLRLVVANNSRLRRLTLLWSLHAEADAQQRRLAAEAVGATLLAPYACQHLEKLELDLGSLVATDVAALQSGAGHFRRDDSHDHGDAVFPRFQAVEWKAQRVPEPFIQQVVRLFGAVGVSELDVNVGGREFFGGRDLSSHALKSVMQDCAATLTSLKWNGLACDDTFTLQAGTTGPSQLRDLRVFVRDASDPNSARAVDALLACVGGGLTSFKVGAFRGVLSDQVAEIIVTRCPRLRVLDVGDASPQFYEQVTRALDDNRCRVSTIIAQAIPRGLDTGWSTLLEALRDTTHEAARVLRVLELGTVWRQDHPFDDVFGRLIKTLSTNVNLTRVVLEGRFNGDQRTQLNALPRRFAVRLPSLRRRLALISVCEGHATRRLPKLLPEVLTVVFAFAGRRTPRYEYLNWMKPRFS